jgi:hypothetical protein
MSEEKGQDETGRPINYSISVDPSVATARLMGRMLRNLGAFLSDVGEIMESVAAGGKQPPDPKPGDKFKKKKQTYVVCDTGKCAVQHRDNDMEHFVWCSNDHCNSPCECMLLRAAKADKEPEYQPDEEEPNSKKQYPYDPAAYWYFCVCVKPDEKG